MRSRLLIGICFSLPLLLAVSCHTYKGGLSKNIPDRNKNLVNKDSVPVKKDSLKVVYSPCAGWGKGQDSIAAVETYEHYKQLFDSSDYQEALPYWRDFI